MSTARSQQRNTPKKTNEILNGLDNTVQGFVLLAMNDQRIRRARRAFVVAPVSQGEDQDDYDDGKYF